MISQQYDRLTTTTNEVFSTTAYLKSIDEQAAKIKSFENELKLKSDECDRLRQVLQKNGSIPDWLKHNIDARTKYAKNRPSKYVLTVSMPLNSSFESIDDNTEWHDFIVDCITWNSKSVEFKTNDGHVFIGRNNDQWLNMVK